MPARNLKKKPWWGMSEMNEYDRLAKSSAPGNEEKKKFLIKTSPEPLKAEKKIERIPSLSEKKTKKRD